MSDDIESERPTEPGGLRPHHVCEHCAPILDELAKMRETHRAMVRIVANPPWLPSLVEAASKASAAVEIRGQVMDLTDSVGEARGEIADLKAHMAELSERVEVLESGCSERHPETPPPGMSA